MTKVYILLSILILQGCSATSQITTAKNISADDKSNIVFMGVDLSNQENRVKNAYFRCLNIETQKTVRCFNFDTVLGSSYFKSARSYKMRYGTYKISELVYTIYVKTVVKERCKVKDGKKEDCYTTENDITHVRAIKLDLDETFTVSPDQSPYIGRIKIRTKNNSKNSATLLTNAQIINAFENDISRLNDDELQQALRNHITHYPASTNQTHEVQTDDKEQIKVDHFSNLTSDLKHKNLARIYFHRNFSSAALNGNFKFNILQFNDEKFTPFAQIEASYAPINSVYIDVEPSKLNLLVQMLNKANFGVSQGYVDELALTPKSGEVYHIIVSLKHKLFTSLSNLALIDLTNERFNNCMNLRNRNFDFKKIESEASNAAELIACAGIIEAKKQPPITKSFKKWAASRQQKFRKSLEQRREINTQGK